MGGGNNSLTKWNINFIKTFFWAHPKLQIPTYQVSHVVTVHDHLASRPSRCIQGNIEKSLEMFMYVHTWIFAWCKMSSKLCNKIIMSNQKNPIWWHIVLAFQNEMSLIWEKFCMQLFHLWHRKLKLIAG